MLISRSRNSGETKQILSLTWQLFCPPLILSNIFVANKRQTAIR
jgi:hypothetical protein